MIQEKYETKLQALQDLVTGARSRRRWQPDAAGSSSLPITRGVIEALRDEPDQDVLGKRLASEAALSSVLEKALLLQRTLLTGKKEPNVAANELAVRGGRPGEQRAGAEINNLKTELELRRTLAGNSAMAIIQRHSTRAAGLARHLRGRHHARPSAGKSRNRGRYAMTGRNLAAASDRRLFNRLRRRLFTGAACCCHWTLLGGLRWRCERRRHPRGRRRRRLAALAAGARRPLLRVAAVPLRSDGLRLVVDASAPVAAGAVPPRRISACCARRSRP